MRLPSASSARRSVAAVAVLAATLALLASFPRGASAQDASSANDAGTVAGGSAGAFEEVPAVPGGSTTPPASAEGQPVRVQVGALPVIVHGVDLKTGTATVTYWFWTRWRGAGDVTSRIEVANGVLDACEHAEHYVTDGVHHAYARCRATARVEVDFRAFPLDRHELRVEFEHIALDETLLRFAVDEPSLRSARSPPLAGWILERPRFDVVRHSYRTNWGAPYVALDDQAAYSRFRMRITMRHAPAAAFAKTFLSLMLSVLITALAFWIDPTDTGARIGLGVAGTFGALTSQVLVASNLPDIGYMTLSDKVHVAALGFIFFVLMESVVVAAFARKGQAERAARIDRGAMVASYTLFLGTALALIVGA
ncbi:MAG: hypothetical protein HY909_27460 [Deltaproteobacteria bacterium]|nr:hypothetical protein [Deltaproteobacteria bacterium]